MRGSNTNFPPSSASPTGPEERGTAASRKLPRHRFDDDIRQEVRKYFAVDNWHGILELLEDWAFIGGAIAASVWAWGALPTAPAAVVYAFAVFIIGTRQRSLADLLHQSSHKTLANNRLLNFLLGTFPSGYLVLQSWTGYVYSHVLRHHPYLGDPVLDPDYEGARVYGIYGEGRKDAALRRFFIHLLLPDHTWRYVRYLLQNRVISRHERLPESLLRLAFLGGLVAAFVSTGHGMALVLYWLVPLLTTANWVGNIIELTEHYPMMESGPRQDIYKSRNRVCGPVINLLFNIHWEGYHLVHHIFPAVPSWHLRATHSLLMRDETYAALHQRSGLRAVLADLWPERHIKRATDSRVATNVS
jgi:fatty acid desaturase